MSDVYKDKNWLVEKYHNEDMTMAEMAELAECNSGTICYWMDKHDIETYNQARNRTHPGVPLRMNGGNYVEWARQERDDDGGFIRETYRVHQLLAVSEFGIDAVKGKVVHHKNGIKWDNRPSNIELMAHGEHSTHHNKERVENGTHNFIR